MTLVTVELKDVPSALAAVQQYPFAALLMAVVVLVGWYVYLNRRKK